MKDPVRLCIRTLRYILAALLVIIVLMIAGRVHAQHGHHGVGHDKLHHWYSQLMRPDMPASSCCSNQDCYPTQARQLSDGTWEAIKNGRWIRVPNDKINREESYDTQAHICAPKGVNEAYPSDFVFCFVKPGAGI